jgi:acetyltransferase-like isoleucine patch superfamily enzyme
MWQKSIVTRWCRTAFYLPKGVLIHPSVTVLGSTGRLHLGGKVSIGASSLFRLGPTAQITLGQGVWIGSDVEIDSSGLIAVGAGTTVQRRSTINGNVSIGIECIVAPNVFISSGSHPFRVAPELSIREQERRVAAGLLSHDGLDKPIVIGDDCWLGANVVVCPGVTIGCRSIIGANSVVTRNIPPQTVAAGSPARKIGDRSRS